MTVKMALKGPETIGGQVIEYHLTRDIPWLLQHRSFSHLAGKYLTEDRLAHAEFVITADLNGVTGGIVIAEKPWGPIGEQWNRYVPNALEIGALFVDPAWRKTPTAFRLGEMAAIEIVKAGKTPVAATEVKTDVSKFLARTRAEKRSKYNAAGTTFIPWVLTEVVSRRLRAELDAARR
jgi:GNAT superfamily N-acetyltransferase